MIIAYLDRKTLEPQEIKSDNQALLKEAVWIDLISPSRAEENIVEESLGLDIPTREEMLEIELSSRLYKEDGALFMTATMLAQSDSIEPKYDAVTFVLTEKQLITVRYIEPYAFKLFISHLQKFHADHHYSVNLLIELLDATVDRLADILELVGRRLDENSKIIFKPSDDISGKLNYQQIMQQIGASGDLTSKARESLATLERLIIFFGKMAGPGIDHEGQLRIATLTTDMNSLSDHVNFLSNKITFLLGATLGMVNIEQNAIIKIVSVAAVIFLPPTLVASIYGMNFHVMPELSWKFGYPMAIGFMIISVLLPYKYFKHRKWL